MIDLIDIIITFSSLNFAGMQALLERGISDQQAILILLIGGISAALGQSVTLFINQVSPTRFTLSISLSGLGYATDAALYATSYWGIIQLTGQASPPFWEVMRLVFLGYSPMVFSIFIFIPFFGIPIQYLIRGVIFLCVTTTLSIFFGNYWIVVASSIGAFLINIGLFYLFGAPLSRLRQLIGIYRRGDLNPGSFRKMMSDLYSN